MSAVDNKSSIHEAKAEEFYLDADLLKKCSSEVLLNRLKKLCDMVLDPQNSLPNVTAYDFWQLYTGVGVSAVDRASQDPGAIAKLVLALRKLMDDELQAGKQTNTQDVCALNKPQLVSKCFPLFFCYGCLTAHYIIGADMKGITEEFLKKGMGVAPLLHYSHELNRNSIADAWKEWVNQNDSSDIGISAECTDEPNPILLRDAPVLYEEWINQNSDEVLLEDARFVLYAIYYFVTGEEGSVVPDETLKEYMSQLLADCSEYRNAAAEYAKKEKDERRLLEVMARCTCDGHYTNSGVKKENESYVPADDESPLHVVACYQCLRSAPNIDQGLRDEYSKLLMKFIPKKKKAME